MPNSGTQGQRYGRKWLALATLGVLSIGGLVGWLATWQVSDALRNELFDQLIAEADQAAHQIEDNLELINQFQRDIALHPLVVNAVMHPEDDALLDRAQDHLDTALVLGSEADFALVDFLGEIVSDPAGLAGMVSDDALQALLDHSEAEQRRLFLAVEGGLGLLQLEPVYYGNGTGPGSLEGGLISLTEIPLSYLLPSGGGRFGLGFDVLVGGQSLALASVQGPARIEQPAFTESGLEVRVVEDAGPLLAAVGTLRSRIVLGLSLICLLLLPASWWIGRSVLVDPHTQALELAERLDEERQRAQAATHAKSRFLANMSHELRTPFNGILGMLELLEHTELDSDQLELQGMATNSARTLLAILDDILDLARIEEGRLPIAPTDTDLRSLLEELLHLLAPAAESKGIRLVLECESDGPRWLFVDPLRLRQILSNLIGNAIKFTSEGHVRLAIRCSAKTLSFQVHDTGIGIAPERMASMFQSFEQEEDTTARRFGGTGLGLAISRQLAELMGGRLTVASQLGEGTCFSLELGLEALVRRPEETLVGGFRERKRDLHLLLDPLERTCLEVAFRDCDRVHFHSSWDQLVQGLRGARDLVVSEGDLLGGANVKAKLYQVRRSSNRIQPGVAEWTPPLMPWKLLEATITKPGETALRPLAKMEPLGLSVLVAEDVPTNQLLVRRQLKLLGCEATLVENGREAIEAAADQAFDLILMDMQMPEVDGLEAARTIRASGNRVPIVALTANVLGSDRELCLEAGMTQFLGKPLQIEELRSALQARRDEKQGSVRDAG